MQLQTSLNFKNSRQISLFLAAIIVGIVSYWNNRNGILTTPDSWAYWEGSISIIEENKFAFLGGGEIYYCRHYFLSTLLLFRCYSIRPDFHS